MAPYIKFNWHGAKILSIVEAASHEGVKAAAEDVLRRAQMHVPLDVGTLMGTGKVSVDGSEASVSYNTVYAAKLHQHPEYNFQGQGEGRWLQNAVEDRETDLKAFSSGFKRRLF